VIDLLRCIGGTPQGKRHRLPRRLCSAWCGIIYLSRPDRSLFGGAVTASPIPRPSTNRTSASSSHRSAGAGRPVFFMSPLPIDGGGLSFPRRRLIRPRKFAARPRPEYRQPSVRNNDRIGCWLSRICSSTAHRDPARTKRRARGSPPEQQARQVAPPLPASMPERPDALSRS